MGARTVGGIVDVWQAAEQMLMRHEGYRKHPYSDTRARTSIGYGRNLTDKGISEGEARGLLQDDISEAWNELRKLPWYDGLSVARQVALIDLVVNLGFDGFEGFKRTIAAIEAGNWFAAGDELRNSDAFDQEPRRIEELAQVIERGEFVVPDKPEQA